MSYHGENNVDRALCNGSGTVTTSLYHHSRIIFLVFLIKQSRNIIAFFISSSTANLIFSFLFLTLAACCVYYDKLWQKNHQLYGTMSLMSESYYKYLFLHNVACKFKQNKLMLLNQYFTNRFLSILNLKILTDNSTYSIIHIYSC